MAHFALTELNMNRIICYLVKMHNLTVINEKLTIKLWAREFHDQMWYEMESDFNSLNPLQKTVLQVMISKRGTTYPPFSEDSMLEYQKITGEATISTASIQSAIEVLRNRGLIWNPSRGYYALEDDGLAEWYVRTHTDNTL